MINLNSKIFITGHKGLVGSAILRRLRLLGYKNLIYKDRSSLNLLDQKKVENFLKKFGVPFIFIQSDLKEFRYSWTETLGNSFDLIKKGGYSLMKDS